MLSRVLEISANPVVLTRIRLQRLVPGLSCGSWAQHFSINDEIGWGIPSNDNRYILDKAVLN